MGLTLCSRPDEGAQATNQCLDAHFSTYSQLVKKADQDEKDANANRKVIKTSEGVYQVTTKQEVEKNPKLKKMLVPTAAEMRNQVEFEIYERYPLSSIVVLKHIDNEFGTILRHTKQEGEIFSRISISHQKIDCKLSDIHVIRNWTLERVKALRPGCFLRLTTEQHGLPEGSVGIMLDLKFQYASVRFPHSSTRGTSLLEDNYTIDIDHADLLGPHSPEMKKIKSLRPGTLVVFSEAFARRQTVCAGEVGVVTGVHDELLFSVSVGPLSFEVSPMDVEVLAIESFPTRARDTLAAFAPEETASVGVYKKREPSSCFSGKEKVVLPLEPSDSLI